MGVETLTGKFDLTCRFPLQNFPDRFSPFVDGFLARYKNSVSSSQMDQNK